MNLKRLSPFAIPVVIRLIVVLLSAVVLTYLLLSSDPSRIFRWFAASGGRQVYERTPDWAQHFVAYLVFSFILRWYAAANARWVVSVMIGFAMCHAAATEFLQRFVPERTSDLKDLVVNFVGIAVGTLLGRIAMRVFGAEQNEADPSVFVHQPRVEPVNHSTNVPGLVTREVVRAGTDVTRVSGGDGQLGLSRNAVSVSPGELKPSRVLNFGFLGGLFAVGVVSLGALHVVHGWQVNRHSGALLELGRKAREQGDVKGAREYIGRYVGLVPTDVNARADYGVLLDQSGTDKRHVFMVYEDILRTDPTREEIRRRQIDVAMEIGRHSDALVHVRFLRQSYPTDGKLDFQAGRCQEELAEFAEAMKAYELALEHDPDGLDTYERMAWLCQTRLDRPERAKTLLDAMVERFPKEAKSWLTRGRFRAEFGSLPEAQSDIDRALQIAPHGLETQLVASRVAYERAVSARSHGRTALAQQIAADSRQQLQQVIQKYPDHVDLRLRLVQLESQFGSLDDAQKQIDELLKVSPHDGRTQLLLADMKLEQGRFEEAEKAIDKLPRTPGSDALRLFLHSRMLMSQSRWPQAIAKLEEARRISTQTSGLIERVDLALAQCHSALNDSESEMSAFRRALKSNPASIPARLGLGACLLRQQKVNEAIAEFRSLAHLPQVRLQLARLLIVRNLQLPELARDWSEAERLLDQSKSEQADPVQETLLGAELLAARGQTDAARQLIEEARTTQTDRVEFWLALSRLAERSGDTKQANLWKGQALSVAGDAKQAEELLRKAVAENLANFDAAIALLRHFVRHNQLDEAKSLFQQLEESRRLRERPLDWARCAIALGQDDAAQTTLQSLLQRAPNDFAAARTLAELHLRRQRVSDAMPLLAKLIDAEDSLLPSDVQWARRQLAVAMATAGDSATRQRALSLLDKNDKTAAPSVENTRAKAFILAASSRRLDQQEAVKLLSEMADRQQLLGKDRWLLARLFEKLGQFEQADAHYRAVLVAIPDRAEFVAEFTQSLIRRGQLDDAEAQLSVLKRLGESNVLLACEVQLLTARGKSAEALRRLEEVAKGVNSPDRIAQLALLAESLQRMKGASAAFQPLAESLFRSAAAKEPRYVIELVRFLAQSNKPNEAFAVSQAEWSRLPTEVAAPLALSLLAFPDDRAARMQQIESQLVSAVGQQPRSVALLTSLADLRCWQERYAESEELYRRVLSVDRSHPAASNNLAWLLAMRGKDLDDAQALIDKEIERRGASASRLDTRGSVMLALRRTAAAVHDFQAANEVPSASGEFHLAFALWESGEVAGAKAALVRAKSLGFDETRLHPLERPWFSQLEAGLKSKPPQETARR